MTTTTKQRPTARKSETATKTAAIAAKHEREEQAKREAAERMAKTTVAPSDNRVERARLANEESKQLKSWERGGSKGKRPSTVNLDAILIGQPVISSTKSRGNGGTKRERVETTVQFSVNGHDQKGQHNRLSTCAARVPMPVSELRALLEKHGIVEPNTTRWSVEIPGKGVTIAARLPGDPEPEKVRRSSKPEKSAASSKCSTAFTNTLASYRGGAATTKQTTKGTPASKRVVDGVSGKPAAKPLARKSVTPLPKKTTAKRTSKSSK